jgi:hypothetical protein
MMKKLIVLPYMAATSGGGRIEKECTPSELDMITSIV